MAAKVEAFEGMSNVLAKAKRSLSVPSMILNATVDHDGSVQKREGHELVASLPGAHSLWTDNRGLVLCAAAGSVYRVSAGGSTLIHETGAQDAPMSYVEVGGKIYISNAYWTGMYDPAQNSMKSWGDAVPAAPILIPVSGGLPAGEYQVCMTVKNEYGRTSGNSAISTITLEEGSGLQILNVHENGSVWMTDPNAGAFQYAGAGPVITELPQTAEPIPTMWGSPPPPMSSMAWAFGRVWGAVGNKVIYSEPYQPELFTLATSFFDMEEPVLLIAKAQNGMFFGCEKATYFLSGSAPVDMVQVHAGPGVVPGTLCYADDLGDLGKNVPIWLGVDGVYAGLTDGRAVNLIKDRVQISPEQLQGASICRVKDGRKQMLFSMQHRRSGAQEIGFGDNAACEVVRRGAVI